MPVAALVDLDGTLVDSNYHHAMAWYDSLRAHGHRVPMVEIHRRVGMGGDLMLEALIGRDDKDIEKGWRANFESMLDDIEPLPGAADLLHALHGRGHTVVLATSSPADLLEVLKAKLDADAAIDAVVTADDVEDAKPEPDVFRAALKKVGASAGNAVVIGDSTWDVKAATRTGVRCIGLETGGYGCAELEEAGAVAVFKDAHDLLARLTETPLA